MTETKQVIAPLSDESVRLAVLAGYNADLAEAMHALNLAGHMAVSDAAGERNRVGPLMTTAIIAYARCFTTSNVRAKLDLIINVPEEHKAAHASLMKLRNSTVAHSESALMPTYPVVNLERDDTGEGADAGAPVRATAALAFTVHPQFSIDAIEEFHIAVSAVKDVLLLAIEDAKTALLTSLNSEDLDTLWENGQQPQLVEIPYDEWNIRSQRPKYPESNIIRVVVPAAQTKRTILMPSSGNLFDGVGNQDADENS